MMHKYVYKTIDSDVGAVSTQYTTQNQNKMRDREKLWQILNRLETETAGDKLIFQPGRFKLQQ